MGKNGNKKGLLNKGGGEEDLAWETEEKQLGHWKTKRRGPDQEAQKMHRWEGGPIMPRGRLRKDCSNVQLAGTLLTGVLGEPRGWAGGVGNRELKCF